MVCLVLSVCARVIGDGADVLSVSLIFELLFSTVSSFFVFLIIVRICSASSTSQRRNTTSVHIQLVPLLHCTDRVLCM